MALTLKSQRQIQSDILNTIIGRLGLNDINPGSVLDILTQAVSQEDFNQYVQMSQIARLVDLDSTTGEDLENRAFEYQITRAAAINATGVIDIIRQVDGADYVKVSTSFVSTGLAPSAGDGTASSPLRLNSVSGFISGGSVVIGRGLTNEEVKVILVVDSINNTLTLSTSLVFDHAFTEEVTFIRVDLTNDIVISAGTTVSVPATGTNSQIDFTIITDETLFAGESTLSSISVRATEAGSTGNIGSETINIIDQENLRATNTTAFTTGRNIESDSTLRDRIRDTIQSLSRGTQDAILNSIVGLVDTTDSKRVVSANVILPQTSGESVKVFIDDGTGFEPSFSPQASETLVEDSSKGTTRLQLDFAPLVKAQIESANEEPFDLSAVALADVDTGLTLTVRIGGTAGSEETINVLASDLEFSSTVRAEEITRIINNKATLFEARTSENGTRVVVTAITDTNEDIFVLRPSNVAENLDLNTYTQFTNAEQATLYLYKNDSLLTKDGTTATLESPTGGTGNFALVAGSVLTLEIDGKSTNQQNITFTAGGTFSASAVAALINAQLVGGIAATIENGNRLAISSATTLSASSIIRVVPQTSSTDANDVLGFGTTTITGATRDYTLNRELGTVELTTALSEGDTITAGNEFSRGTIRTPVAVTSGTRINQEVGFSLIFDVTTDTVPVSVTRKIVFADDRFSSAYLDDNIARTNNVEFGFNKITQINNLPQYIADYVTKQIYPLGKAVLRTIGSDVFIEIRTNTFTSDDVQTSEANNGTNGTLQLSTLTTNAGSLRSLGIWEGVAVTQFDNQIPHTGFRENTVVKTFRDSPGTTTAPSPTQRFDFSPTDTLVVVMNNDQTNGTFVLPISNLDVVAAVDDTTNTNARTIFRGSNLSTVYGTTLSDTDRDYGQSANTFTFTSVFNPFTGGTGDGTTTVTPIPAADIDVQAAWTNLPENSSLLDYFISFTGLETETIPSTGAQTVVQTRRNSLGTSASGTFRVGFTITDTLVTAVNAGTRTITVGVAAIGRFTVGDSFFQVTVVGTEEVNTEYTISNIDSSAGTFVVDVDTNIATVNGTTIRILHKPREATPIGAVSAVTLNDITTATYSFGTGATSGTGQLTFSDITEAGIAVGDVITFSGMGNSVNDGTFLIEALGTGTVPTIDVVNTSAQTETGAAGTAVMGQKRRINGYNFVDGSIQVDTAFREEIFHSRNVVSAVSSGDQFYVIASTPQNVQQQLNNSRLSSVASQAEIVNTDRGQRIQISSLMNGSAGYVEVTGGNVNNELVFLTAANRGLQGYNYYTGLLTLVHNTIYGDDTDLATFPGVGAAGVNFQVLAPTVTEIILEIDVTLQQGVSIAAVENEVNTAITGYVNGLGVGDDVIVEEIRARTIRINGITDVSITRLVGGDTTTTTIANIAIADNEIARIKTSDITLG